MSACVTIVLITTVLARYYIPQTYTEEMRLKLYNSLIPPGSNFVIHKFADRGLGILLLKDLKKGSTAVGTPTSIAISSFDVFEWYPYIKDASREMIIVMRVIYEKFVNQRGSIEAEYVHSLPVEILCGHNMTADEESVLYTHSSHKLPENAKHSFEDGFIETSRMLTKVPNLSSVCPHCFYHEVYTWAFLSVMNRGFFQSYAYWRAGKGYPTTDEDLVTEGLALYPLIDLVNHSPTPRRYRDPLFLTIQYHNYGVPSFYLISDRDFPAGSELVYQYADRSSMSLLFTHGFVTVKNTYDFHVILTMHNPCFGDHYDSDGYCVFKVRPYEVHKGLLRQCRDRAAGLGAWLTKGDEMFEMFKSMSESEGEETKGTFLIAMRYYHTILEQAKETLYMKWSLRGERRTEKVVVDPKTRLAYKFGIGEKVLILECLKLGERLWMKALWETLKLTDN